MKKSLIFLAAAAIFSLNAEVLWQADFSKELAGFTIKQNKPQDSIKAENGELVMKCTHGPHKGVEIVTEIPFPETGDLSFDVVINAIGRPDNHSFSLKMNAFGKLLSWGIQNLGFAMYCPVDNKANWITASKYQEGKKANYRLRFDRVKGTLDVFVDGSFFPSKSYKDVKFAEPVNGKTTLLFGNYGYASGVLTHKISNLKLETVSDPEEVTEPKVVWSEKFEKDGTPADNGFKLTMDNKKDQFTVKDGVLTMICQNSPHKGMTYEQEIPGLIRGELTFEALTGVGAGYDYYCLRMRLGSMTFAWRARNMWHLYHPSEPKWYILSKQIKNGVWHKYKIRFDAEDKTAEFYIDDMENPAFIDTKSEYVAKRSLIFQISNYGLCSGTVTSKIRNIELKAVPKKKRVTETP